MFTYLFSPLQRYWFLGLLILWAVFLFGGFILGGPNATQRMPRWARMASSATLVVAAWSWYVSSWNNPTSSFAFLLALGMSLGFCGDLLMAGLMPGGRSVMGGMAAFGLGHIFYIVAFVYFGNTWGLNSAVLRAVVLVIWLLIGAGGWYLVVFRGQQPSSLHYAALPYALLLASTAGFATVLALQNMAFTPLAIGAALFLVSDLILAAQLFSGLQFPLIGDVIWLTYGPGQALIVYAAGVALWLIRP